MIKKQTFISKCSILTITMADSQSNDLTKTAPNLEAALEGVTPGIQQMAREAFLAIPDADKVATDGSIDAGLMTVEEVDDLGLCLSYSFADGTSVSAKTEMDHVVTTDANGYIVQASKSTYTTQPITGESWMPMQLKAELIAADVRPRHKFWGAAKPVVFDDGVVTVAYAFQNDDNLVGREMSDVLPPHNVQSEIGSSAEYANGTYLIRHGQWGDPKMTRPIDFGTIMLNQFAARPKIDE